MGSSEELQALEGLMVEFFSPSCSNERKREIEVLLDRFRQQRDSWSSCLYFLSNTGSEYVTMYCLTVLQELITRQWVGLPPEAKVQIRTTVKQLLVEGHARLPAFVRNKLAKLYVDIGRSDWPHFCPDFFTIIMQLVVEPGTCSLGLTLLQTTSEELGTPRDDLSAARREEVRRLMLAQVPSVLTTLNKLLEGLLEKGTGASAAATPPNSPGRYRRSSLFTQGTDANDASALFKSPAGGKLPAEWSPSMDGEARGLCRQALHTLLHLFSWIPISSCITPLLLSTIFRLSSLGAFARGPAAPELCDVSGLAMGCINELLAKNCVPPEFQEFLMQLFQHTFALLQRLTADEAAHNTVTRLDAIDQDYLSRFTEFLNLFVSIHLRRFEASDRFPVQEFLSLLFKYTFKQPSTEGFFSCLSIWHTFLDYLQNLLLTRVCTADSLRERYRSGLCALADQTLRRVQFQHHGDFLDTLDDESLDSDEETAWQHYLRQCLELIAKVAELLPDQVLDMLHRPFSEYLDIYLGLEAHMTTQPQGGLQLRVANGDSGEQRQLHYLLRDLSSLLQGIGRLVPLLSDQHFDKRFSQAQTVIQRLAQTVCFGSRVRLFDASVTATPSLQVDFAETHAQALAAIKAFTPWLCQCFTCTPPHTELEILLVSCLQSVLALCQQRTPVKVMQSATHLVVSLLTSVRPAAYFGLTELHEFYRSVGRRDLMARAFHDLESSPSKAWRPAQPEEVHECEKLVVRGLSHYLSLPWCGADPEQRWEERRHTHQTFLAAILAPYLELKHRLMTSAASSAISQRDHEELSRGLDLVADLIETIGDLGTSKSKVMTFSSLEHFLSTTAAIAPSLLSRNDLASSMLRVYLALFRGLQQQLGTQGTQQILSTCFTLFTREHLEKCLTKEGAGGAKVVEKFVELLIWVVNQPGRQFKSFLPTIITVATEHIYPVLAQRSEADIKPAVFRLLHQLLLTNWHYFFMSSLRGGSGAVNLQHQPQLMAIMEAFGQSFLQPDIELFRQNIEAMEDLNMKCKLYTKDVFREVMLQQFLAVLLGALVRRSHDLLQEEISAAAYSLASVDFNLFFNTFLADFLRNMPGLDSRQRETLLGGFSTEQDLPSFVQSLQRFCTDLRYYQMINSSLPPGTIQL